MAFSLKVTVTPASFNINPIFVQLSYSSLVLTSVAVCVPVVQLNTERNEKENTSH